MLKALKLGTIIQLPVCHNVKGFNSIHVRNLISSSLSSKEMTVQLLEGSDSGVVVFSLNRPSARNALGSSLTASLMSAVDEICSNENARVLILRSLVPGIFCSGADLKERLKLTNKEVGETVAKLNALALAIENIPIPTIAAIDGVAFGGGLEIALGCDIRIVSEHSKMGLVETKWAIIPGAGGSQRLPRIINPAIAKEMIYCARVIDGHEAKQIGLANHLVNQNSSSDAAFQKSVSIAREILANGPLGVRMAKVSINKGLETDIVTGCKLELLCYSQLIPTTDRIEGLKAFKENRPPQFKGE